MASSKVYVGGLPWTCNAEDLKQVCSKFGFVEDAFIVMDKTSATPRSKGFGFVTFADANDAATCLRSLNGSEYGGRILKVGMAHKETGGSRGFSYAGQQGQLPGRNDVGMAGRGGYGGRSGGLASGGFYGQYDYSAGYGSEVDNGSYGYPSDNGGIAGAGVSNTNFDHYGQERSQYSMNDNSYNGKSQYGAYGNYGNSYSYGGADY